MFNKNFSILVIGQIISLFGSAIQRFCMSLYLLECTGSTATFANILAFSTLPYILFAPIAGKLTDKVNRKKIMVWLDFCCSLVIGIYTVILWSGQDKVWIVGTVMFLLSIGATLYGPAVTASIPQIVEEGSLTTANGIVNQIGSLVNFLGPILAGILYGLLGIQVIVAINGISFFISAIMELFLEIPDIEEARQEENIQGVYETKVKRKKKVGQLIGHELKDMKENFRYLKSEKQVVLGIIASYAFCNIFLVPILSIIAPYFIKLYLGLPSQVYGIVEGVCVLGMILGGMLISVKPNLFTIQKVHRTYFPMLGGVLLLAIIGFIRGDAYILAGLFGAGGLAIMFSLALSNVLTLTFIQKEIPKELLGRVSAFSTAIATISVAPGQLLYGQVIEKGIPIGVILLVTAVINIGLIVFVKWNVRKI